MTFRVLKPATDHVASTLAFILVLATWCVAYVAVMPADPVHRVHVARVSP